MKYKPTRLRHYTTLFFIGLLPIFYTGCHQLSTSECISPNDCPSTKPTPEPTPEPTPVPTPPFTCADGLDIAFVVDSSLSMENDIEQVKIAIPDIANTAASVAGSAGYRLSSSLIEDTVDNMIVPIYLRGGIAFPFYNSLPSNQKLMSPHVPPNTFGQVQTVLTRFGALNNATQFESDFNNATTGDGHSFNEPVDLGIAAAAGFAEISANFTGMSQYYITGGDTAVQDTSLPLVTPAHGDWRLTVARYIIAFTDDQCPGWRTEDPLQSASILPSLIAFLNSNGIKVFVLGPTVETACDALVGTEFEFPYKALAEQTGGSVSTIISGETISDQIISACENP